jgi:hypothetical protein
MLLAVLSGASASAEALQASGITAAEFAQEIQGLSDGYIGDRGVPGEPRPLTSRPSAQVVLARAEGLAAGFGSKAITDDHVLLALFWEKNPTVAEDLLGRRGITRARLLDQLKCRGVQLPALPPPRRVVWGPWTPVPPTEALAIGQGLRRDGILYRLARRGVERFISTAREDQGPDLA